MTDTPTLTSDDVLERLERRRNGRTLRAFADELGVSHTYLWDVLRGHRPPGSAILEYLKLAKDAPAEVRYRALEKRQ